MNETEKRLKLVSRILLRCLVLVFGLLIIWFLAYLAFADLLIPVQARIFDLAESDVRRLNLEALIGLRTIAVSFFLCPLIAIKLTIRSGKLA